MSEINFKKAEKGMFIKESIHILHEAYIEKKLVLFIGAGVDHDSGLPLWGKSIEIFCNHMNIDPEKADNLKIPQFYFNSRGKKEYVELCRKIFHFGENLPINALHEKIIDFNVNTIITTNYTHFLEQEMDNKGHIYRTVCQDKDLPYIKNENLIIKMHGDFEHDNFVLKEDDYLNYSDNFRLIETYIKAVIAKNVVLFIGYSFQDPDVKQLFSWVKNILGNDFQQAYMLAGFDHYDENEFEYYKNLGVNVIFTETFGENRTTALLNVMDLIKDGDPKNLLDIEAAANYFKPYLNFNYILGRYLKKGLAKCKLETNSYLLSGYRPIMENINSDINKLLLILSERITEEVLDPHDPYSVIVHILQKSGIDQIERLYDNNGAKSPAYIDIPHKQNKLIDLIITFDYESIRAEAEHNEFFKKEDAQFYMHQAYIYYTLEEYAKAYTSLSAAAKISFQKHCFYTYYIAQFNKCKINACIQWSSHHIPQDICDEIKKDSEHINLNNIIMDMPDLSSTDNQMLKDLDSFQLQYSLFQDAYRMSQKVKKQQDTSYFIFAGIPDYAALEWMVKDYYYYLVCNHLMIDHYKEVQELFVLYVKSMFGSATAPDQHGMTGLNETGNIHASDIGIFELFLIIKYMPEKDIIQMFSQHGKDTIPVQENCNEYMTTVIKNLRNQKGQRYDHEFWNGLLVLSYMDIKPELAEDAIDRISEKFNWLICQNHLETLYKFLNACYSQHAFRDKQDGEFQFTDYALGRFLQVLICNAEFTDVNLHRYCTTIQNTAYIFYHIYHENLNPNISNLLVSKKNSILATIYPYCDEKNKRQIEEYFQKEIKQFTWKFYGLYYQIVSNDIIKPDKDYEQLIFSNINEIKKQSQGVYPNQYENILITMINLKMNHKILNMEKLNDVLNHSEMTEIIFLNDTEHFDYNEFNLDWLLYFSEELLNEIASNKTARTNIAKIYAEKMENGKVNEQLLKIFFKHFIEKQDT